MFEVGTRDNPRRARHPALVQSGPPVSNTLQPIAGSKCKVGREQLVVPDPRSLPQPIRGTVDGLSTYGLTSGLGLRALFILSVPPPACRHPPCPASVVPGWVSGVPWWRPGAIPGSAILFGNEMNSSDHSGHNASRSHENDTAQAFRQTPKPNQPNKVDQNAQKTRRRRWATAGLALTPVVLISASWLAPKLTLPRAAQDLSSFLLAVATISSSLFLLAKGALPTRPSIVVGSLAGAGLATLAMIGVHNATAVILVGTCLVALGHAVGHAVGSRIEHPGHLLPACVVAACVDIASVIHPQGPTHAVVSSQRALDLLTLSVPVLGTHAYAPSIGVGDIVFSALLLGTVVRHNLSLLRTLLLIVVGLLSAGLASALLERAIPALPAIGLWVLLGLGSARRLQPRDRKTAGVFMVGAVVLAIGVVASRFIGG